MWNAFALLLTLSATASGVLMAAPLTLKSPETQVSLLELYTSEGCSSCPPADRWFSALKDDARLWRDMVPVAFHVDYWNDLGWPDRFASSEYSQRQRRYAEHRSLSTVYTPALVLNGREWRRWLYGVGLPPTESDRVGSLALEIENGAIMATFSPITALPQALQLHVAVLGFDLTTKVRAGENSGATLKHDFAVLGYRRVDLARNATGYSVSSQLPPPNLTASRMALAAWVSGVDDPRPLQAVGGWLEQRR